MNYRITESLFDTCRVLLLVERKNLIISSTFSFPLSFYLTFFNFFGLNMCHFTFFLFLECLFDTQFLILVDCSLILARSSLSNVKLLWLVFFLKYMSDIFKYLIHFIFFYLVKLTFVKTKYPEKCSKKKK